MLYLNDKQMEEVKPDMTAREIRGIRTPDLEPEEIEEQIPEQVLGQMCLEDYPEILPEEKHGPAKCITGKSKSGICGAAAYCSENYSCCLECDQNCNSRCGWLDDACDVAQDKQQPSVENVNMDCPPDQGTCPRQNWGTSREDQHEGQKQNKTHWMAFIKTMEDGGADESRRNCSKTRSKTDAVRSWNKQKYIAGNDSADIKGRNQEAGKICGRAY